MPYVDAFPGKKDIVQKCDKKFCLIVNLKVKNREGAKFEGVSFSTLVNGASAAVGKLTGEACFTLVFDDNKAFYTVTVTHEESGFTGANAGTPGSLANPPSIEVILSKPWDLVVLVKEKWPDATKDFAKAKLKVAGADTTANSSGRIESSGRTGDCQLALNVKGLVDEKCKAQIKTQLPQTKKDGFLAAVDPTVTEKTGKLLVIQDQPGSTVTVTYAMEVTLIKPVIAADAIALVNPKLAGYATTPSEMTLKIDAASQPADDLTDLKATLAFDDKIKCYQSYKDNKLTDEYATGVAVAPTKLPAKLYVQGQKQGETKPALKLSTERAEADRSWRISPDSADFSIWVQLLKFDVWKYSEGLDSTAKVTGSAPLNRELHNRKAALFTSARLTIAPPDDQFWGHNGIVTLSPTAKVSVFKAGAMTTPVSELKQSDFANGAACEIRAVGTGGADVETESAGAVNWNANYKREPEKLIDAKQDVSCGAKAGSKDLKYGDVVKLETYAFDAYLDRMTSNACCTKAADAYGTSDYNYVIKDDVALAFAGAHKYYTKISGACVNKNYSRGGFSIFGFNPSDPDREPHPNTFIGQIKKAMEAGKNNKQCSTIVTGWIKNRLAEHDITLHDTVSEMIRQYIERVLGLGAGWNNLFGFDNTRGVPGVHAEVLAINEICNAINGIKPEDITVATYRLQESNSAGYQGRRFVACLNCSGILLGGAKKVRVITG